MSEKKKPFDADEFLKNMERVLEDRFKEFDERTAQREDKKINELLDALFQAQQQAKEQAKAVPPPTGVSVAETQGGAPRPNSTTEIIQSPQGPMQLTRGPPSSPLGPRVNGVGGMIQEFMPMIKDLADVARSFGLIGGGEASPVASRITSILERGYMNYLSAQERSFAAKLGIPWHEQVGDHVG